MTAVAANEDALRFYEREGYEAAFVTMQRRTPRGRHRPRTSTARAPRAHMPAVR